MPELIQREASARGIAEEALRLLNEPSRLLEMKRELARVRELLQPPGAVRKTAELALAMASPTPP